MKYALNRRRFLETASLASLTAPLVGFPCALASENLATDANFVHFQGSLYLVKKEAPFTQQLILAPGHIMADGVTYSGSEALFPLEHLNTPDKYYFLTADNPTAYRVFEVDAQDFDSPIIHTVTEIRNDSTDDRGQSLIADIRSLYLVTRIDNQIHFLFLDLSTLELIFFILNEEGYFSRVETPHFSLPKQSTLHMLPDGIVAGKSNMFLLINNVEKSHQFFQFQKRQNNIGQWEIVSALEHNALLDEKWAFQYSPIFPTDQYYHGDDYSFLIKISNKQHAFLFKRPDQRFAALTFQTNTAGALIPTVLCHSDNKYTYENTYHYGSFFHSGLNKDFILCKDREKESLYFLSIEESQPGEYSFIETPLNIAVNHSDAQKKLQAFFAKPSEKKVSGHSLYLRRSRKNSTGIPVSLTTFQEDNSNPNSQFHYEFIKTDNVFETHFYDQNSFLRDKKKGKNQPLTLGALPTAEDVWDRIWENKVIAFSVAGAIMASLLFWKWDCLKVGLENVLDALYEKRLEGDPDFGNDGDIQESAIRVSAIMQEPVSATLEDKTKEILNPLLKKLTPPHNLNPVETFAHWALSESLGTNALWAQAQQTPEKLHASRESIHTKLVRVLKGTETITWDIHTRDITLQDGVTAFLEEGIITTAILQTSKEVLAKTASDPRNASLIMQEYFELKEDGMIIPKEGITPEFARVALLCDCAVRHVMQTLELPVKMAKPGMGIEDGRIPLGERTKALAQLELQNKIIDPALIALEKTHPGSLNLRNIVNRQFEAYFEKI